MAAGDLNKKFGWIWLLIGPILGMYIGGQLNSPGAAAYASVMEKVTIPGQDLTLYMGETGIRMANRLLHVHSALLAFTNIFYGFSIDSVPLSERTKRLGSVLAVVGAILATVGFYFLQVMSFQGFGFPLRVLGGISMVAAIVILVFGQFKK